jgi:formate dehydrogenase iron-sulfur subunit
MAPQTERMGLGARLLVLLGLLGLGLAIWRWLDGIGPISNLNQGSPWGFWIGFDILAGIALAAGGFVVAGLVHIFGAERYHPLVRPAIFTALLGYLMFIGGLLVDIGRPWAFWHAIIYWNHESPMFEVAWCVMMYTTVLLIEVMPYFLERWHKFHLLGLWRNYAPWAAWLLLVLFITAMTQSIVWVAALAVVLILFETLVRRGAFRRDPRVPTLLIMAGILFSTMHQSSLGTVFTMVPHKLSPLWYSPILPILFFISAVMAGLAMVIVESTLTARHLHRQPEIELLRNIGRGLGWAVLVYTVLRIVDLSVRGAASVALQPAPQAVAFWIEIVLGLAVPLAMLVLEEVIASVRGLLWAALFVVVGVVIHRLNVVITGLSSHTGERYFPHWMEVAVSVGVVALGILAYRAAVRYLPLFDEHGGGVARAGAMAVRADGRVDT